MSESAKPPVTETASRSVVESSPRVESRPERGQVISSFNTIYDRYAAEMSPLLSRLQAGETLSREERRDANNFRVTKEGLQNVTDVPYEPGTHALPDDLGSDEWNNVYRDSNGEVKGKQREGIVTNHMLDWWDAELKKKGDAATPDEVRAGEVVRASSGTYKELHQSPGSIDVELRKRQEAGALIHPDPFRDSQIPQDNETDRAAHERDDWQMAADEIDGRLELVLPPITNTKDGSKIIGLPTVRVDSTRDPIKVHIPDSDGPKPSRVSTKEGSGVVDMGGGEVVISPTEITSDYVPPAERTIPDVLAATPNELVMAAKPPKLDPLDLDLVALRRAPVKEISDRFGERSDLDEDVLDRILAAEGSKGGREKVADSEAKEDAEVVARTKRLITNVKGLTDAAWRRAKTVIGKIPPMNWPKIPKKHGAALAAAGLAMLVVAQCGEKSKSQPAELPGRTYEPNAPTQIMMDRPGLTSPAQIVENVTGNPFEVASIKPATPESRPEGGFGGGKGPATKEEDFSVAERKQNVRGLVEDQLAQKLNPEYKKVADEAKAAKARGDDVNYSEVTRDYAAGTLEDFKGKLTDQYGEAKAKDIYDNFINELVLKERDALENYNQGVKVDPDGTINGIGDKVKVLDFDAEADGSFSAAANVPSLSNEGGILQRQYSSNFKPGE